MDIYGALMRDTEALQLSDFDEYNNLFETGTSSYYGQLQEEAERTNIDSNIDLLVTPEYSEIFKHRAMNTKRVQFIYDRLVDNAVIVFLLCLATLKPTSGLIPRPSLMWVE